MREPAWDQMKRISVFEVAPAKNPLRFLRSRRVLIGLGLASAVLAIVCIVMVATADDPDVKAIRKSIESAKQAALHKDVAACLDLIDESYTDNLHNDYAKVRQNVGRHFDEVSDLRVKFRAMNIEVDKSKGLAMAKFEMHVTGKADDGTGHRIPFVGIVSDPKPFGAIWESVTLLFAKRDGRWLVTRLYVERARN